MTDTRAAINPEPDSRDSPDCPEDEQPDTVATPEGDNEAPRDQPLEPVPEGLQRPRTNDTNEI
ncbi:MAG: hypothetical protein ABI357_06025 [Granulicella sp.]